MVFENKMSFGGENMDWDDFFDMLEDFSRRYF